MLLFSLRELSCSGQKVLLQEKVNGCCLKIIVIYLPALCLCCWPVVSDSLWPHGLHAAHQASLSLTIFQSSPKFMSIASVMPSSYLVLWCPLILLPSIFPNIRDFSNELTVHIRWLKYWSFSFNISPSNKYSGLISLKIDWFDLLAVRGTLRSLLQHHSSKASILWCSTFFCIIISYKF